MPERIPAFPVQSDDTLIGNYGMELRDYFAIRIVVGLLRHPTMDFSVEGTTEARVRLAYNVSDLMMRIRNEGSPCG